MPSTITESILSSSGIAYGKVGEDSAGTHLVSRIFIRNDQGYFALRIDERSAYGVDYGVIGIEPASAYSYNSCSTIISDIEVGYVVISESSYRPDNVFTVSEFAQLIIEHTKGTLTLNVSDDQSGIFIVSNQ